jgi:hypothetical protein
LGAYPSTNPNSYTSNTLTAGTGVSVSASTGASTITNTGVTSIVAGTGISISGGTGAVTVTNSSPAVAAGLTKAWVNFAGSNGTINASYNVSSVTRNATGKYNVNFTSAFADTNYVVVAIVGNAGAPSGRTCSVITDHNSARSTSTVNLNTYAYQQQAEVDYPSVQVMATR